VSFVQPAFPVFLVVVFGVYWALRGVRAQNTWLVAASVVFYGWIHPWFVLLMYGSAVVDFMISDK